ncbi:lysine--tRNA ligase, partial [Candidatus Parcubacteria bacterium]|nr:lysine--tRNA ligase [Candidatus Parcubacteria bacterium]
FVYKLQDTLPAVSLTDTQKEVLKSLAGLVLQQASAEDLHQKLHESKEFKIIYQIFLGKESGPKAGWFLASLPKDFVVKRLREASMN